jgi:hypothetical protein
MSMTLARPETAAPLDFDPAAMRRDLNCRAFTIGHRLVDDPLFSLPALIALSRKLPAQDVEYNAGDLPVEMDPAATPKTGLSIEETIRRIEECGSWMVMKFVERVPEYRCALDRCLDQVASAIAPDLRMLRLEAFVFISSPGSVTPYHIDHEYNFLLQVRGKKSMSIFDRSVVSEQELERFYRGEHRNLALAADGRTPETFELRPGDGVHVPVNAPHYVVNGPEASVSFSITFRTPEGDRRSAVYVANDRLRRLGLQPRAVGEVPILDHAKYLGYSIYQQARRALGRS